MPQSNRLFQLKRNRYYAGFWSQRRNQFWAAILAFSIVVLSILGIAHLIINGINTRVTYTGDSLLRVFPKSEKDKIFLQKFDSLNIEAQVWGLPINNDVPVLIYAKAGSMYRLEKTLKGRNMTFNVLIPNIQKLIDREERSIVERRSLKLPDSFDFENYHPYDEILEWMEKLADSNHMVRLTSLGKTHEKNDILLVSVSKDQDRHDHIHENDQQGLANSTDANSKMKPVIYINCGIHAREWISISSCLWMISELTTNGKSTKLLEAFDFWFVPVANPDGYIYTWTTDRMWRKNRAPGVRCYGVDLNRNFDVGFNDTSKNSCSSGYGGPEPFSEEETKTTVKLLSSNRSRVKAALFMHSFSQLWLSPYGVNKTLPNDYQEMERVMSKAVNALKSRFDTEYQFGSIANVLYAAPGTAVDYCYEKLGITYSFVVELRDKGTNAFMLPIEEIKSTVIETWDGVIAMVSAIQEKLLV